MKLSNIIFGLWLMLLSVYITKKSYNNIPISWLTIYWVLLQFPTQSTETSHWKNESLNIYTNIITWKKLNCPNKYYLWFVWAIQLTLLLESIHKIVPQKPIVSLQLQSSFLIISAYHQYITTVFQTNGGKHTYACVCYNFARKQMKILI